MPSESEIETALLPQIKDAGLKQLLIKFLLDLYTVYKKLYFTYLEINPLGALLTREA